MVVVAITGLNNADDDGLENVGDERWCTDTHTFISENHSAIIHLIIYSSQILA